MGSDHTQGAQPLIGLGLDIPRQLPQITAASQRCALSALANDGQSGYPIIAPAPAPAPTPAHEPPANLQFSAAQQEAYFWCDTTAPSLTYAQSCANLNFDAYGVTYYSESHTNDRAAELLLAGNHIRAPRQLPCEPQHDAAHYPLASDDYITLLLSLMPSIPFTPTMAVA